MVLFLKLLFGPAAVFLSALVILSCFTSIPYLSYSDLPDYTSYLPAAAGIPRSKCGDIFRGEWVPDLESPAYTNETCPYIQVHQNCMMFGRPDLSFLKWRWQPASCDLPRFNAHRFLRLVRHKTLAFVGDSLARNHMQSLLCLLAKAAKPRDMTPAENDPNKILYYERDDFTIRIFWSPFLVRSEEAAEDPGVFKLYLDEPDGKWLAGVAQYDYVVFSAANWFTRPSLFYEHGQLVGGSYVSLNITSNLTLLHSHRAAFRTALRALNLHGGFTGKAIVRTLSPMSHFEGGTWDKGGDCRRTRPYRWNETASSGVEVELYRAQVEEFREALAAAAGVDMVLMDATAAMLMRPDGHPSQYGHWPNEKRVLYNDCVHWCLPGPIDAWNDMLLHMLSQ